jgi:hypothetical protein
MKKIIPLLIVLFWLSTMAILIQKNISSSDISTEGLTDFLKNRQQWMSIYYKDEKIGFVSSRFYKNIDSYTMDEALTMRLKVMGTEQEMKSRTLVSLSPDLRILSFKFNLDATQDIEVKGRVKNKVLSLTINTEGNTTTREIKLKKPLRMPLTVLPFILKKGLKKGVKADFPVFDPMTMSMQDMHIEVAGMENIVLHGKEYDAFKIIGDLNGMRLAMWVDENGNELKEESPMGFTLIHEPMEMAIKNLSSSADISDLVLMTAIPFNIELPDNISYLKVRIKGVDLQGLDLHGGRQRLEGDILEITRERIPDSNTKKMPLSGEERFLEETPFVQKNNPAIKSLAEKIINGQKDPLTRTRLLWKWVYENIEKTPSITVPSAVDVLKVRKGDCNEHAVLFTALARSAGIPTRISTGLVYKDGYFYYHAWPEVFTDRWIAIDPTLSQFPADAAHIRLIWGGIDKQVMLMKVINSVSLQGIDYK